MAINKQVLFIIQYTYINNIYLCWATSPRVTYQFILIVLLYRYIYSPIIKKKKVLLYNTQTIFFRFLCFDFFFFFLKSYLRLTIIITITSGVACRLYFTQTHTKRSKSPHDAMVGSAASLSMPWSTSREQLSCVPNCSKSPDLYTALKLLLFTNSVNNHQNYLHGVAAATATMTTTTVMQECLHERSISHWLYTTCVQEGMADV